MGQMFDKTRDQMNNWRWDNPHGFGDQVDRSNSQRTSPGKVKRTAERVSWYGSDDLRASIGPPSCRQYKPGVILAVRPLNWDEIIDEDDDDENWADPGAPSGGRSCPGDGNDNDNGESEEDTQGGEKGTGKGKGTKDVKGKEKGKGKGNGNGKGIVKQTPGGDDISLAVALQLQKEMYEADSDMEGILERLYSELEASPAVSISSDDDTDSTESDGEYDSEHDPDVDMGREDDVDAVDGVDLNGDVNMEKDADNEKEEDEEEEDEDEEKDKDEEEDKDEDDGKEPRTIGQGVTVNSSADDVDTMVDHQPIVLPEQGQEMREHTPQTQPPAPAPQPQTPEPRQRARTPETHSLSGLEHIGFVGGQKPRPVEQTRREAEAAGKTSRVDVDQQLLGESAGCDSLPNVPLPDAPLPEARLDGSVGKE